MIIARYIFSHRLYRTTFNSFATYYNYNCCPIEPKQSCIWTRILGKSKVTMCCDHESPWLLEHYFRAWEIQSTKYIVRNKQPGTCSPTKRTISLVHVKICRSRRHQSRIEDRTTCSVFYGDVLDAKRGVLDTGYNWKSNLCLIMACVISYFV